MYLSLNDTTIEAPRPDFMDDLASGLPGVARFTLGVFGDYSEAPARVTAPARAARAPQEGYDPYHRSLPAQPRAPRARTDLRELSREILASRKRAKAL